MSEQLEAKWYVIHTYSGYEMKVKTTLDKLVENRGLQDYIQEVLVVTEDVVEVKEDRNGNPKRETVKRKRFPGYVFVKMVYNEEIWFIVRNTRGVTGFVGANANRPDPMTDDDLLKMGVTSGEEEVEVLTEVDYEVGDTVRIVTGIFADTVTKVEKIDLEKQMVTVRVSALGRETPVELGLTQVVRL